MRQQSASQQASNSSSGGLSTQNGSKFTLDQLETIVLSTVAFTLLEHKIFLLALHVDRLLQVGTIIWLPSVLILDISVFAIVFFFFTVPTRSHLCTKAAAFTSRVVATLFAAFIVIITCISLVLMVETGIDPVIIIDCRTGAKMEIGP